MCQFDWQLAIDVLSALLTPTIAAVAEYIAWQQWSVAWFKTRLDVYDRRLRIYNETNGFISSVCARFSPTPQEFSAFWGNTSEADFLVGADVRSFLDELYSKSVKLWSLNSEYDQNLRSPLQHYDPIASSKEKHALSVWFTEQLTGARDVFGPYLDLRHKA